MPTGAWELDFGCTNIADPLRVQQYVANAQDPAYCVDGVNQLAPYPPQWGFLRVNCGCDALNWYADSPGATPLPRGPFTTPALDLAPWHSDYYPESSHFWGWMVEKVEEVATAPITRSVTDRIDDFGGSILGPLRKRGRAMRFTLIGFGAYEAAMDYGYRWLADTLLSESTDCELCEMTFRIACPTLGEAPTYDEWDAGRWTFKQVGVIDGPRYEDPPNRDAQCNVRRVSFTVVASIPYGFKCPVNELNGVTWIDNLWTNPEDCPPLDWICTKGNDSVCVPLTNPIAVGDETLTIEVHVGTKDINNLTIKVTPDPFGYVCGTVAAPPGFTAPDPCYELTIPQLPANSIFRYDGVTSTVRIKLAGHSYTDGTRYLDPQQGPPQYPSINGGQFCICIESDRCSWEADGSKVYVWSVHRELGI